MTCTTSYDERLAHAARLVGLARYQQRLANEATERARAACALLGQPVPAFDADEGGR
jgi:hypothetical protein